MDNIIELVDNSLLLQKVISKTVLSSNELAVLELRYCHNMTFDSIGKELGLSGGRIFQINARVLRKLRFGINGDGYFFNKG